MTNGSRIAATPRRTVEPHWTDLVALVPDSRTPPYLLLLSLKSAVSLLFSTLLEWRWSLSLSFMASSLTISRNRPTRKVFVAPHNVQPHLMIPRKLNFALSIHPYLRFIEDISAQTPSARTLCLGAVYTDVVTVTVRRTSHLAHLKVLPTSSFTSIRPKIKILHITL